MAPEFEWDAKKGGKSIFDDPDILAGSGVS
jgi:hypothetical protein